MHLMLMTSKCAWTDLDLGQLAQSMQIPEHSGILTKFENLDKTIVF